MTAMCVRTKQVDLLYRRQQSLHIIEYMILLPAIPVYRYTNYRYVWYRYLVPGAGYWYGNSTCTWYPGTWYNTAKHHMYTVYRIPVCMCMIMMCACACEVKICNSTINKNHFHLYLIEYRTTDLICSTLTICKWLLLLVAYAHTWQFHCHCHYHCYYHYMHMHTGMLASRRSPQHPLILPSTIA